MRENKWKRSVVLGFDPIVSLNFLVFQLLEMACLTEYKVEAVEIYSSETGRWIFSECGWGAPPPHVHVVCNPATREWLAFSQPSEAPRQDGAPMREKKWTCSVALGFDPAISLNFHVFQLPEMECLTECKVEAVEIYSSETGRLIFSECGWSASGCHLFDGSMTYLNSVLHNGGVVVAVDTKGETWRVNHVRLQFLACYGNGFIRHSQGRLLYMFEDDRGDSLSVYVLEDRGSEEWTFKHNISKADLFLDQESVLSGRTTI